MAKIYDTLAEWGSDIEEIRERFLDDEEFYVSYLSRMLQETGFQELGESLRKNSLENAFDCAHALKSIVGNSGVEPMLTILCEIVETLRKGGSDGVQENYRKLLAERERLEKLLTI